MDKTCNTCEWWDRFKQESEKGICRASPPWVSQTYSVWPETYEGDRCAKWEWNKQPDSESLEHEN
jgi:hypothetical protein